MNTKATSAADILFLLWYGRGSRWYIVAGLKIGTSVELSFKYSETFQIRSVALGTETSDIIGPLDNRITVQMDAGF